MYLSLLQIKNFRCFDGNEHSITFKKGLNVLVGENDSGKSAIMDAIKLVLGTTDMNWYRVEQEDFYFHLHMRGIPKKPLVHLHSISQIYM